MTTRKTLTPQLRTILEHCKRVGHITARTALIDHGICALPRRIKDLKELGYAVLTERTQNDATGQRYVRYHISGKKRLTIDDVKVGDRIRWTYLHHDGAWQDCVVTEVRSQSSYCPVSAKWDGGVGAFDLFEIELLTA